MTCQVDQYADVSALAPYKPRVDGTQILFTAATGYRDCTQLTCSHMLGILTPYNENMFKFLRFFWIVRNLQITSNHFQRIPDNHVKQNQYSYDLCHLQRSIRDRGLLVLLLVVCLWSLVGFSAARTPQSNWTKWRQWSLRGEG